MLNCIGLQYLAYSESQIVKCHLAREVGWRIALQCGWRIADSGPPRAVGGLRIVIRRLPVPDP